MLIGQEILRIRKHSALVPTISRRTLEDIFQTAARLFKRSRCRMPISGFRFLDLPQEESL